MTTNHVGVFGAVLKSIPRTGVQNAEPESHVRRTAKHTNVQMLSTVLAIAEHVTGTKPKSYAA